MGRKRTMFRYADKVDKVLMLLGTMGCIGDGLMSPLTMLVLSGIINEYGGSDLSSSNQVVDKYSLRLLFVAIGVGVSAFFEGICWTRTAERQTSRMRTEYLKSILGQEVGFFDNQSANSSTSHVISTMSSDAHSIQDAMAEKIPNCLAHFTSFIFSIVVSFILSWRLALASLPFSLGFIIPGLGFGKIMMKLGIKMKNAYGVAGLLAEQAISSIRTVYSYVGEKQTLERFSLALQESKEIGIKLGFTKGLLIGSMGMVYGAWAFQAWVGSVLVSERGESGGKVFISGVSVVLGGISCISAFPNLSFITEAKASSARIFDMIDRSPATTSDKTKKLKKTRPKNNIRGEIEFKNVYFNYPSRPDTPILQNFNLKAKAGKTVGLVGGSGCGKSTVVCLLERFYDPVKGDIFLDGFKIKKVEVKWLRSHMGLVNQEPVLFATSIKENILFGKEGATMELVVEAAKAANAHDFIIKLPNKYDTQVGQFGVQLSGGQKQRIAIARALLKDPKILLLDEATSALDAPSEQVVQDALDQASHGRTTIIIAHRLTTIRKADKIAVIQSGRVVEFGSHDELIQPQNGHVGAYAKMVQLQQSTSEKNKYRKTANAETPNARIRVKSNWQNSPVFSPFTPYSIQVLSYYDSDDSYLEKEKPSSHNPPSLRRLLRMNAPEWKRSLLGCLGACLFGAIQPINAYCLGSIVSVYFLNDLSKIKSQAKFYTVVFLTLAVLSFVANLLQHYNFAIMGECLVKRVREKMLQKLLSFEVGWFDQDENTSGAVCARLQTEANMVRSLVGDRISLLVQVFVSASFAFILGLVVTWRVSAVMIATQPLVILCFYSKSVLMKVMSEKARKAQNEGCQLASEAVVNHRTITAFSSQDKILELFELTLQGPKRESIKQSWFSGFGLLTSQFLTTASVTLTFWYGGRLMNQRLVTSKHLFQAFFILMSTGKNIADAGSMTSDLAKGGNAVRSVFEILDRKSEIEPEKPERPGKPGKSNPENPDIRGRIELRNVYFSYPSRPEQVIFQGLNLKIEAGKRVVLVGESGSGKSTIIGLVERFYDPIKGSVLIDDEDIKSYNLRWLRSHIALVSQEPTLFAGTIRENIIYGNEGATEGEIRKAAKLANAHEFISSMKDGYGTYCGERGVQLSGGQKQRIALARAILKNPKILLLDEATSALDSVSENLVQESLEKLMINRTCIVVAHRLSTIQKSDSIAVIKNGKVVEKGSHSDLLAVGSEGFYYNLIKLQSGHSM